MTSTQDIFNQRLQTAEYLNNQFAKDLVEGLTAKNKFISPKYFYDEKGSEYFDQICHQSEYYPYRTEMQLLPTVAKDLSVSLQSDCAVVEFGAGALIKIRPLLENIARIKKYYPIDISGVFLRNASEDLCRMFPHLSVFPVEADFCLPVELGVIDEQSIGFFPGSTIGNFNPTEALNFLINAKTTLRENSMFLIGVDTKKSANVLHAAYNDKRGVTAKFNLNVLARGNRDLGANFQLGKFEHYAHFDTAAGCVKMFLLSCEDQQVELLGNTIEFKHGEAIHTECSYKYAPEEFWALAEQAGWQVKKTWQASDDMFAMYLLSA